VDRLTELLEALACHEELSDIFYSGKPGDTAQDEELSDILAQSQEDIQANIADFLEARVDRG